MTPSPEKFGDSLRRSYIARQITRGATFIQPRIGDKIYSGSEIVGTVVGPGVHDDVLIDIETSKFDSMSAFVADDIEVEHPREEAMKIEPYKTWRYDWSRWTDLELDAEVFELRATEFEITPSDSEVGEKRASLNFNVRPTGQEFSINEAISYEMLATLRPKESARYILDTVTQMAAKALVKAVLPDMLRKVSQDFAAQVPAESDDKTVEACKAGDHFNDDQCDKTVEACKAKFDNADHFAGYPIPGTIPSRKALCPRIFKDAGCGYDPAKHEERFVVDGTKSLCNPAELFDHDYDFDFGGIIGKKLLERCHPSDEPKCEHCFGTGLLGGFQRACPAGCKPKS